MALPQAIHEKISQYLREGNRSTSIKSFSALSGGCINPGGRLHTTVGNFFLKWNNATRYAGMFASEAKGLKVLSATHAIRVPKVIFQDEVGGYQFLMLELVEEKSVASGFWRKLGEQLAALHRFSEDAFGLSFSNYIGSLPQSNSQQTDWVEFFIGQRLLPQLDLLRSTPLRQRFEKLFQQLPGLLPVEKPSLLHGDLWSGNLLRDESGRPCLIDPAVYYGHREAELAFTRLFGGFDVAFYESYNIAFPMHPGFEERVDLYNLYPLLVHTNLFGGGYQRQVETILRQFGC